MSRVIILSIVGSLLLLGSCKKETRLSYADVVGRMTDLSRVASLPEEGEKSGMFSSYDRKSKYDGETGQYVNWSANNDGLTPQYIRKEGENMVLAEMKGPGAIVRIWSASPAKGHVKIYIDGNDTPVVDLPFIDYFNTASLPVFNYPNLVYETKARGFNNYVPITFQDSIKIVGEPGWGQYYHFNYITFPGNTKVEEFKTTPSQSSESALGNVNETLGEEIGRSVYSNEEAVEESVSLSIGPGEEKNAFNIKGTRAITEFRVKVDGIRPEMLDEALRKTILTMKWDGEEEPSVWSPVGDFFGSAPGFNEYRTLPMGMEDEEMYSWWYMPFSGSADISVKNTMDVPVEVSLEVVHEPLPGEPENYGRFHAWWHRDVMPVDSSRWPDWTVLKTEGRGRFVGMFLSVWNPKGGSCRQFGGEGHHWWGEGDEKFFVDGEKFPSTFGTGTEDYFGYAWCMPDYFEHAYHSQNFTQGNMGYQSLNRWQIIDNVPFQESFEAYMEKYFPNKWPTQYATVAYWYLGKGGVDPVKPTPADELYGYEIPYSVYYAEDVVEAEDMKIVSNSGGWASPGAYAHEKLYSEVSGHKILIWFAKEEGENILETAFNFDGSGRYKVTANILRSNNGGRFDILLNGKELKKAVDFRQDDEIPDAQLIDLGVINMEEGEQKMTFKFVGEKPRENKLAVDYLRFEPLN